MSSRSRTTLAVALSVAVPFLVAVVVSPALLPAEELPQVTVLLVAAGSVAVGLAVYVALRDDDVLRDRAEAAEHARVEFRRAVARLGDTLAATRDLSRLSEVALHEAVQTVGASGGVFFSVNAARMRIQPRATAELELEGELPWGKGLAGGVAAWGRAVVVPRDTTCESPEPAVETAAAVPLFSRGAIFGVLALYGTAGDEPFTEDTLETLLALARHTEAAIDNVYLQEETRRLSITDGLTGLWNRREFELRARQEFERATRFQREFAVILLDIDNFKEINDTFGHHGGDSVLVELAGRLASVTREIDTVARYGGDEFALLLPETGPPGGRAVAEKIREVVDASPFEFEGESIGTSVSIGVAAFPTDGVSARRLVVAADEALYRAKRGGRNRVDAAWRADTPANPGGTAAGGTPEGTAAGGTERDAADGPPPVLDPTPAPHERPPSSGGAV